MSAQQNMGGNLVFIPHQILIFDVENFGGALKQPQNNKGNFWWSSEAVAEQQRKFLGNTWAID